MASSSLVMIFVQHTTDGCPNSGAEKEHLNESAFTEQQQQKAFAVLFSYWKLYPLFLLIKKTKLLGFFPN